jgi:hypothetical protein
MGSRPSFSCARNRGNELSELAGELVREKTLGSRLMMPMSKLRKRLKLW